jgi:hypothetical protein
VNALWRKLADFLRCSRNLSQITIPRWKTDQFVSLFYLGIFSYRYCTGTVRERTNKSLKISMCGVIQCRVQGTRVNVSLLSFA